MKKRIFIILGSITGGIILIIGGLFIKWPQETAYTFRMLPYVFVLKTDAKRVHGLQELKKEVVDYARRTGKLPETIDEISFNNIANPSIINDPVTKQRYHYGVSFVESRKIPSFEICANFQGISPLFMKDITPPCHGICTMELDYQKINPIEPDNKNFEFWDHGKGNACYTFDATGEPISAINVSPY